jgi:hypothetical protein
MFDHVYIKIYQCFLCLKSFNRFIMKYIIIASIHIFSAINIDTLHYKFDQTSNSLTRKNQNGHSLRSTSHIYFVVCLLYEKSCN